MIGSAQVKRASRGVRLLKTPPKGRPFACPNPLLNLKFSGRVAAVTGAASGIGLACATRLAALGAKVALIDRDAAAAQTRADVIGPGAIGVGADVSNAAGVDAAIATATSSLGPVDVLVCSAGIGGDSLHTVEVTDDEWRRVFAVNCDGVFYANRAVLGGMVERGYGRIVNVASIAGKEGNPMAAAYSASKAAVIGMTKSIGKDVAGPGCSSTASPRR